MLGFNGGLLGVRKVPTFSSASGSWSQNEQSLAKLADIWPLVPIDPLTLSPAAWWDASDATTITTSAGKITTWNDKSGNGKHLTQATDSLRPLYTTSAINGLSVADWGSSANDKLMVNSSSITALEIYCVVDYDTAGSTFSSYQGIINPNNGAANGWTTTNSGGTGFYFAGWEAYLNGNESTDRASTLFAEIKSPCTLRIYRTAGSTTSSTGVVLGSDRGIGGSRGWTGYIGEILVFSSALSTINRYQLTLYLKAKWGI